jgi:hypothetical protein
VKTDSDACMVLECQDPWFRVGRVRFLLSEVAFFMRADDGLDSWLYLKGHERPVYIPHDRVEAFVEAMGWST